MREPACWEMHWLEVSVLDGNANALGIAEPSLMDAAGMALAVTARELSLIHISEPTRLLSIGGGGGGG